MSLVRRIPEGDRHRWPFVPEEVVERARLVPVPTLWPGTGAMTLGRWVLVRRRLLHDHGLIGHELVHVRQWWELGVVTFLWRYLGAYLRGRRRGLGHRAAYLAIPLEEEARRLAGD